MVVVEWIGIGLLLVLLAIAGLFARRAFISRGGGTIRLNLRLSTLLDRRGWAQGYGRFVDDELRWYRLFSFAPRPRRVLRRHELAVESRRQPEGQERFTMPPDWIILRCAGDAVPVEIAMARSTVTGFSSWLEAGPPGSVRPRFTIADEPAA
jgi:hypothetical protein